MDISMDMTNQNWLIHIRIHIHISLSISISTTDIHGYIHIRVSVPIPNSCSTRSSIFCRDMFRAPIDFRSALKIILWRLTQV
ncbi:hypothetical protein LIPSTDRAFT_122838 [Lipomyces starkeyi NRRL Y-11557]|uniref:Uncharacterized protein n=1 Tax=Lipomyces starkeyi NRRL Y-11557 TaxID=675824 RepID=A0A1E3QES1_LIPST|nr:hypothetical protein LIPSTDRAFT_122838 [Lipomyces starkeyi NRRL Y-11557]